MPPRQLDLFGRIGGSPEPAFEDERRLADRVPSHVRFGTSSWTFPGWGGLVYPGKPTERELVERGLEDYARYPLFRTVGIDRSFYRPLDLATVRTYAAQLPEGFPCVSKVWSDITTVQRRGGEANPAFLNVDVFEREVLSPLVSGFSRHLGPMVFEFPPSTGAHVSAAAFAGKLDEFLARLSPGLPYAVEIRNRELLTPSYLDVLAARGVGHVLNFWEAMPPIGAQLDVPGVLTAPFVVCRLLIPPGRRYEERKAELAPFDRIVDPQERMRSDVAELARACAARGKVLFVIVNNKAEGSSPLTVRALAERMARPESGGT